MAQLIFTMHEDTPSCSQVYCTVQSGDSYQSSLKIRKAVGRRIAPQLLDVKLE